MIDSLETIIIGDVHSARKPNYHNSNLDPAVVFPERINSEILTECVKTGIKNVIFVGDIFDHALAKAETIYEFVDKVFKPFPQLNFFYIAGNHDLVEQTYRYKRGRLKSYIDLFTSEPNVTCLDDFGCDGVLIGSHRFFGLSYQIRETDFIEFLDDVNSMEKPDDEKWYLVSHQDRVVGKIKSRLSPEMPQYEIFDKVFNGHIHQRCEIGDNWCDVGSLTKLKADDVKGGSKGYYRVSEGGEVSFKEVTTFPDHVVMYKDEFDPLMNDGNTFYNLRDRESEDDGIDFEDTISKDNTTEGRIELTKKYTDKVELSTEANDVLETIIEKIKEQTKVEKVQVHFRSIYIENFRSVVEPLTYYYDKVPMLYIKGLNGSGKSTTINIAPTWLITGKLNTGGKAKDVLPYEWLRSSETATVRLTLEREGVEYVIERTQRGNTQKVEFYKDGEIFDMNTLYNSDTHEELTGLSNKALGDKQIEILLGIPVSLLPSVVFLNSGKSSLISLEDKKFRELFESLLDAGWADEVNDKITSELSRYEADLKSTTSEKEYAQTNYLSLEENYQSILTQKEAKLEKAEQSRQTISVKISEAKREISLCEELIASSKETEALMRGNKEAIDELKQTVDKLDRKASKVESAKNAISVWNQRLASKDDKLKGKNDELEEVTEVWRKLDGPNINVISSKLKQERSQLDQARNEHYTKKSDAEAKLHSEKSRRIYIVKRIEEEEEKIETNNKLLATSEPVKCEACGQIIPEEDKSEHFTKYIEAAKKELERNRKELEKCDEAIKTSGEIRVNETESMRLIDLEIRENSDKIRLNDESWIKWTKLDSKISTLKLDIQVLNELESAVDKECVEVYKMNLKDLTEKVESVNYDSILTKLKVAKDQLEELKVSFSEEKYREITEYIPQKEKQKSSAELDAARLTSELNSLSEEAINKDYNSILSNSETKLAQANHKVTDLDGKVKHLETKVTLYKELKSKVHGVRGLKSAIIGQKIDVINNFCKNISKDSNLTLRLSVSPTGAYIRTIDRVVYGLNEDGTTTKHMVEADTCHLSDGEKSKLNLQLIFAIRSCFSSLVDCNLIVLDEPFLHVSPEEEDIFEISDYLSAIANEFDLNMHVITHERYLPPSVPEIRFSLNNGRTRLNDIFN